MRIDPPAIAFTRPLIRDAYRPITCLPLLPLLPLLSSLPLLPPWLPSFVVYQTMLTDHYFCILMEYCRGGDLFHYITKKIRYVDAAQAMTEDMARYFFRQIIGAVGYCHSKHVAHRDIKLANVLLDASSPPKIKLCDFGLSKLWQQMEDLNTHTAVGTPAYMPPEILTQLSKDTGYDPLSADVWSCGVFLYVMLLGKFPFQKLGQKVSLGTNFRNILCQISIMVRAPAAGALCVPTD